MKDLLVQMVRGASDPQSAQNLVREYLQARILGAFQRGGAMIPLAFQGGTALRFLFGLPRYSEDLDFALEGDRDRYDLRAWLVRVRSELATERYEVALKVSDRKTVHSAFVAFPGLLFELALSAHRTESLSVKVEVDTRPPGGAGLETTVVRRHLTLRLQHHDRPSLFAGKLHAVLARPYPKGRDLFDLQWYLADRTWPEPNLVLLNNALKQSGRRGPPLTAESWRRVVRRRLVSLPWERVRTDVRPFLESGADEALLDRRTLLDLVDGEHH